MALIAVVATLMTANAGAGDLRHSIPELKPVAKVHLGKTADWVAIAGGSVWVGTTGPNGVSQIDPETNTVVGSVRLPGNPCAGLAAGFGGLWVPLCARPNSLARVDLKTRAIMLVPHLGPAAKEGGITTSADSVWLVTDGRATLARIDPGTLRVRQRIRVPRGSHNPLYSEGRIWISRSAGAEVNVIRADTGLLSAKVPTGPKPRFLAGGGGSVWTLNQGDGSLTRIDAGSALPLGSTRLKTPGPGGDIAVANGIVWTTMVKMPLSATDGNTGKVLCQFTGPGGDSLGVGGNAIWLTDYAAGDVYRYDLDDVMRRCQSDQ